MIQSLLFLVVGIALYFFADWLLRRIEAAQGGPLPYRPLVFFGILLVSALLVFGLIRALVPA